MQKASVQDARKNYLSVKNNLLFKVLKYNYSFLAASQQCVLKCLLIVVKQFVQISFSSVLNFAMISVE